MIEASGKYRVHHENCLRGGAAFFNIHQPGAMGCQPQFQVIKRFITVHTLLQERWDFIVMQDQTQTPTLPHLHYWSLRALNETYADPIINNNPNDENSTVVVFFQTAGYRNTTIFETMTRQLYRGYAEYAKLMSSRLSGGYGGDGISSQSNNKLNKRVKMALSGNAYAELYPQNLWERLYQDDGIHPSILGTWLQASVLYSTILNTVEPPVYNYDDESFWKGPVGRTRSAWQLPTPGDAQQMREAVIRAINKERERATAAGVSSK